MSNPQTPSQILTQLNRAKRQHLLQDVDIHIHYTTTNITHETPKRVSIYIRLNDTAPEEQYNKLCSYFEKHNHAVIRLSSIALLVRIIVDKW